MNTFALELWYDEGEICTFYTVRLNIDEDSYSETDKFFDKYAVPDCQFENEGYELFRLITQSIANKYGATNDFFDRSENNAHALPPKPKKWVEEINQLGFRFPLRLYCFRVTEQIVILFNGGIKDARTAQESENLSIKFYEAQTFVKKIEEALQSEMITITDNGRYLQNFDSSPEIIL